MNSSIAVGGILCAGFGTRLSPITDVIPKPLIPFMNTPLLAYAMDHLVQAGIKEVGINLFHLAESIPPVADRLALAMGQKLVYAREWEILGTAGGARGIWKALGEPEKTLIVLNGDSVMNIDLAAHLKQHKESGALATLVVRPKDHEQPGRVWVDESSMSLMGLRDFRHPEAPGDLVEYDFTGVHFIEPALLRDIPLEMGCLVGDVYGPRLERGERLNISVNDDFWAALDNPDLFMQTTKRVLEEPALFRQLPLPEPLGGNLYIFSQDGIDDKAKLAGPVLLGAHVKVEDSAQVGPNAVVDGVELVAGASIQNAILYGMGRVEGEWKDCLAVAGQVATVTSKKEGGQSW